MDHNGFLTLGGCFLLDRLSLKKFMFHWRKMFFIILQSPSSMLYGKSWCFLLIEAVVFVYFLCALLPCWQCLIYTVESMKLYLTIFLFLWIYFQTCWLTSPHYVQPSKPQQPHPRFCGSGLSFSDHKIRSLNDQICTFGCYLLIPHVIIDENCTFCRTRNDIASNCFFSSTFLFIFCLSKEGCYWYQRQRHSIFAVIIFIPSLHENFWGWLLPAYGTYNQYALHRSSS